MTDGDARGLSRRQLLTAGGIATVVGLSRIGYRKWRQATRREHFRDATPPDPWEPPPDIEIREVFAEESEIVIGEPIRAGIVIHHSTDAESEYTVPLGIYDETYNVLREYGDETIVLPANGTIETSIALYRPEHVGTFGIVLGENYDLVERVDVVMPPTTTNVTTGRGESDAE